MGNGPAPTVSTAISTETNVTAPDDGRADLDTMTEQEAARLTTKIQRRLDMVADSIELVIPMIEAAKNGNAHQALGYQSWTAYVADKFGGTLARLGKSERLPFVELLADQGMSTRAIASVVGVSKSTVADDLSSSGHLTAEPVADYLAMADATEDDFEAALSDARSEDDLSGENVISIITNSTISKAPAKNITGTDGKTYRKPQPQKLRARPLPDRYWRKAFDVAKATGQLRDLTENRRRYPPNAAAITDQCAGDVLQALADMITVVDRLDPQRIVTNQRRREFLLTQIDRLNDALVSLRNQAGGDAE